MPPADSLHLFFFDELKATGSAVEPQPAQDDPEGEQHEAGATGRAKKTR